MLNYDIQAQHFTIDGRPVTLSADEIAEMNRLDWFQHIPFAPGITSPGREVQPWSQRLQKYGLNKASFQGMSVLGVGCYEGFPLYLAEALGAERVVGVSETFGLYPDIARSREFARKKLHSKVEFVDLPIEELSSSRLGTFDVVLCYDCLVHFPNPLRFLELIFSLSKGVVLLSTPFVVSNDKSPWVALLPGHTPPIFGRSCSGPNLAWIEQAVEFLGYRRHRQEVFEWDFVFITAVKKQIPPVKGAAITALPPDDSPSKTAVLMISCERYRQVWEPFFALFRRYWPDCPYKVYFGVDRGSYPGVATIEVGEDRQWASNALAIMSRIPEPQVLLFQEDFLLTDRVDTRAVGALARHLRERDAACIRMVPLPGPSGEWPFCPDLGVFGAFDDFRFSFQLTMWNSATYRSLLQEGDNPWTTEFVASRRATFLPQPFLGVVRGTSIPVPYEAFAIERGEWKDSTLDLLRRENISLEGIQKKIP